MKTEDFILVYLYEEDSPPRIESNLSKEELNEKIKKYNLHKDDFAIIQGKVLKNI